MPRLAASLSEMALPQVGATHATGGFFGAESNPRPAVRRQPDSKVVPPKPHKHLCCKTCGGDKCVGHCKF